MACKPVLKWVGGKTQILSHVFTHFPHSIHNYYEPFLGGGSVLIELLNRLESGSIELTGHIFASDFNGDLVHLYQCIKDSPLELIEALASLKEKYNMCPPKKINARSIPYPLSEAHALESKELYYYFIRQEYNQLTGFSLLKSAYFLFLNKTCFRGMYRVGPKGFNVPYGNYENPAIYDEEDIQLLSSLLKKYDVRLDCTSFEEVLRDPERFLEGDFIYLDPPYVQEKTTSFVKYLGDGFCEEKHRELFDYLRRLTTKFVLSNSDTPLLHEYFHEESFLIEKLRARRAIKAKDPSAMADELIICRA